MAYWLIAVIIVAFVLWLRAADADLTTLFGYYVFYGSWNKYKGKVVWITGASSGIGEQVAYVFARVGAKIILSGTRQEELERVRNSCQLKSEDCDVFILQGNIANIGDHPKWVQTAVERFGTIDVLVNNAGRSQRANFVQIPSELERELFEINVFGMISLTREVLKHWEGIGKHNGEILVSSSTAGKLGAPYSASYCGSKHALHGFFETLRSEKQIEGHPMTISLACPGPVRSNIRVAAYTHEPGQTYNQPDTESQKLMDPARCARLMVSGLAWGLDETWIAQQPILVTYYLSQYAPSVFRRYLLPFIMTKNAMKMRDGKA